MNFDLGPDQRDAAAGARDFFRGSASPAAARAALEGGPVEPGHEALAAIGFLGITVPESAGGAGAGLLDLAVVAEQGGAVLAGPSLVTAARAAVLLGEHPDLAARLADGSARFAVVDGPVTGSAPSIDAAGATLFLGLDGGALVVGEGEATAGPPMDATRGLASVRLTSRRVLAEDAGELWARARQVAAVVLAAEDLGAADRAVQLAVGYAQQREAFGRRIGSYQAVKHLLVDAWVGVDQLRSLVWWAAWAADAAAAELPLAASAAKASAAEVLERAAETCIQVHGGIGFTWEHDAHLYWRRAKVDRLLLGDAAEHLDAVARLAVAGALG
ncbi:acyl-CoA dehydrogenase family protein [Geodermatophilus sabuli]|uniref:Acyl-CoA dehydrogenase, N-terminal domain n=1 Tax=Geodermatophilus sabuli TaxID=1564158 RepID=A0A285E5G9_9ACTN|nr:acyl-CoA dehydrogenase family protein [Geodermatophilus sabuli]MBB3082878.1 alkylation response protein AidB-like acyl-CoA dehydrogenase [Geodermatophilus sabuli]SNX94257.1 Acyl-CoA dehydrogenase, N-terminal domain [Geodermatophilus sabuli]